jgi:hypothetical protein
MNINLKQTFHKLLIVVATLSPAIGFAGLVTEDALMRRDDSIDAHNRRVGAEMAREKTKTSMAQAKLVYDMHLRLGDSNTASRWELYKKLVDLLNAQLVNRVAEHLVTVAGVDEQIGALRRTWREGSAPVNVVQLAKLLVEKRESALIVAEGALADYRQLSDARKAMYVVQEELARRRIVSEEERHLAMVLVNQASAEATISASELEIAKEHLAEAKRDLEDVGGR